MATYQDQQEQKLRAVIRDEIFAYENGGFGSGQTPREYAEALTDKVTAAIIRLMDEHAR